MTSARRHEGLSRACVGFVDEKRDAEADEKIRAVKEKHIQYSVRELGRVRVEGVDEERDDPLVAHRGANVDAEPLVVSGKLGVHCLEY